METETFTHDGVVFHYDCKGEGKKHVMLQHGLSDYAPCWGEMISDLSGFGYRVVMMDARGHGRSGKPDVGYNLDTLTADMMALISHLRIDPPVIIGHSMGGNMSARAASSFPAQIRAVVLIDPVFDDIPEDKRLSSINERVLKNRKIKKMSHKEIQDYTRSRHPMWEDVYVENYAMSKIMVSEEVFNIMMDIDKGWRKDLEKAQCPIMIVTGDKGHGAIVSKDTSAWIHDNYPDIRILHVPDVGHSAHRENYQMVITEIKEYLLRIF